MDNKIEAQDEQKTIDPKDNKKPNENAGFYFSSFLKITDPNTQEVLVQMRGDN